MAYRQRNQSRNKRYFGEFKCECGRRWMSAYSWENTAQKCKGCNTEVMPHSLDPLKGKKYLVEYECDCGHSWTRECYQGNKEDVQICDNCFEDVYPDTEEEVGNKEIPHPQHLCGKCRKLGRFCGKYS